MTGRNCQVCNYGLAPCQCEPIKLWPLFIVVILVSLVALADFAKSALR